MNQKVLPAEMIAMQHAINLAQDKSAPLGPNPRVGCVFLSQKGEYLTEGFHNGKGTLHAERLAISQCTSDLAGSTAIVTLEPCYQPNKDTDCARSLVEVGISRIVIAQSDITPKSHGGADYLEKNGIEVIKHVMLEEASGINPWLTIAQNQGRPYVRLKIASSLDGKVAAADGSSRWISSQQSRNLVHDIREQSHVIISSTKSVMHDNAQLTARTPNGDLRANQPMVLLLGNGSLPKDHPIYATDHVVSISDESDLVTILDRIWNDQQLSVLVEAGPILSTAFIESGLVNELIWFTAPKIIGNTGLDAIMDIGVATLTDAMKFHLFSSKTIGADIVSVYHNLAVE